jgi:hypothetical protein
MNPIPLIQSMVEVGLEAQFFLTQPFFGAAVTKLLADGLFDSHTQNSFINAQNNVKVWVWLQTIVCNEKSAYSV